MIPPQLTKTSCSRSLPSLLHRSFLLIPLLCLGLPLTTWAKPPFDPDRGNRNTSAGDGALFSLTLGTDNSAFGYRALFSNTIGSFNTGLGSQALFSNTTGDINTATGYQALLNNTTGAANTATGSQSLFFSTVGNENTANGYLALFANTTGNDNTATGANSLSSNTSGSFNSASSSFALQANTTGSFNTATGSFALSSNTTGSSNIAVGYSAGSNLTDGFNNIDIGNQGVAGESGVIRVGTDGAHTATHIAGIFGASVTGVAVMVDANGQLGTVVSSRRFKDGIKPLDKASEVIFALKPVTFRYKEALDSKGLPQFGLIAEEVAKVNPDLVIRDADGNIHTVRYEAVNAMLLNEFLKQHQRVEEQDATIAELKATIAEQHKGMKALAASVKEQASQIQQVNRKLEATKPAPKTADNTR